MESQQHIDHAPAIAPVSFGEALRVWAKVAALSFGGPAGQIAVMHRVLVEEKRWVSEERFLHALNYCMLLPGPEAQQLATYIGWLLHGTRGGLAAGTLFILPGIVAIMALSWVYAVYQKVAAVEALFFGLKAAVIAIVIEAVFRIGRRALKNRVMVALAAGAFLAIFFLSVPFPAILAVAATIGWMGVRFRPDLFRVVQSRGTEQATPGPVIPDSALRPVRPTSRRAIGVLAVCLTLWFAPQAALRAYYGPDHVYVEQGLFFSKAAMVTFGGAYAVLPYVGEHAVERGWVSPEEMLDGLGMAETTPGPLIMVLQFVGFMGAYRQAATVPEFSPLMAATIGGLLTTWVTFVPCFLWIFLGAPYIERLRRQAGLTAVLSSVTAAVVGVVLNLAVWFALHALFQTDARRHLTGIRLLRSLDIATLDWAALVLTVLAFVALFGLKLGMIRTLAASVAAGFIYFMFARV